MVAISPYADGQSWATRDSKAQSQVDTILSSIAKNNFPRISHKDEKVKGLDATFKKVTLGLAIAGGIAALVTLVSAVAALFFAAEALTLGAAAPVIALLTAFGAFYVPFSTLVSNLKNNIPEKNHHQNKLMKDYGNARRLLKRRLKDEANLEAEISTLKAKAQNSSHLESRLQSMRDQRIRFQELADKARTHFKTAANSPELDYV